MSNLSRRMPAEWEKHDAVMMSLPNIDTDWAYILDEVTDCYRNILEEISKVEDVILIVPEGFNPIVDSERIKYVTVPYNDTWIRDYGPITVENSDGSIIHIDFGFNAWGLKFAADRDNLVNSRIAPLLDLKIENRLGFILEGGSIESDGMGTILTTSTCLLSPNRNGDMSASDIEAYLKESLGASRVLWLHCNPLEGDDTDAHIDTIARLAPNDTIIYTGCDNPLDVNYPTLHDLEAQIKALTTAKGKSYSLIRLPSPDPIGGDPATYANYLVTPTAVFVPTYNQPANDSLAISQIAKAFPDRAVKGIDCRALIKQHGSLHCATMQLKF